MFGSITAAASAAAPHIGKAAVSGAKAAGAMAVASKATTFANRQVKTLLTDLTNVRVSARETFAERKEQNTTAPQVTTKAA